MKIKRKLMFTAAGCISAAGILGGCANPQKEGTAALEEGNYEEALTQFQKAAESEDSKKSAEGYRGLGMAYYESGEYGKALEAFQQAVDLGAAETVQLYHLMASCGIQTWEDEEDYTDVLEYIQAGLALAETDDSGEVVMAFLGMVTMQNAIIADMAVMLINILNSFWILQYPGHGV